MPIPRNLGWQDIHLNRRQNILLLSWLNLNIFTIITFIFFSKPLLCSTPCQIVSPSNTCMYKWTKLCEYSPILFNLASILTFFFSKTTKGSIPSRSWIFNEFEKLFPILGAVFAVGLSTLVISSGTNDSCWEPYCKHSSSIGNSTSPI